MHLDFVKYTFLTTYIWCRESKQILKKNNMGWLSTLLFGEKIEIDSSMKYLIVGLGNIGAEYCGTRHNIGFMVADALAEKLGATFSSDRYASVAEGHHKGRTFIIIKPSTYMNLSGNAVRYWMQKEKIPVENIMVLVDDIALPVGSVRMRKSGSDGGHNGLKHIASSISTESYARIRLGVGGNFPQGHQVDYVLGEFTAEEKETLKEPISKAVDGCIAFSTIGVDRAMNSCNTKVKKTD